MRAGTVAFFLDCAGRAQRRRRFWGLAISKTSGSLLPKRCRALLATAVQNGRIRSARGSAGGASQRSVSAEGRFME